ncbi:CDP-glucose 4,6-dehydratase [Nitrosopumilus sp. b2]|uniref:CDP-glucose 4,6-dehydratase n=1 Tax=Nitrosopumilus sp. b2 TaxID=2109908 RepID=UPI0015F5CBD3|nr:CDP-glucose 4,6-dehydratase [Nitrosopumilus sp. b2]KAF6246076.1 CDP-glucose 4,6-dehydratase [Nitrosopumilus sp. b2]
MKDFIFENVFLDKTALITGHTGFIGSWLTTWLIHLGANVVGVSLEPPTNPSLYESNGLKERIIDYKKDIRDYSEVEAIIKENHPEFVFHLAAQSLVLRSYMEPSETFSTNTMGTVNILEAIRNSDSTNVFVNFTSDKCYENKEIDYPYNENDKLGGHDPYSASKATSEIITNSFRQSFFENNKNQVSISTIRAGNVIGGGDWAENRLIPDCIRHFEKNEKIIIRNPNAIRPWQHVFEPISGMLLLAYNMKKNPTKFNEPWNIGPNSTNVTVKEVVEKVIKELGNGSWEESKDDADLHEANILKLDSSKIQNKLNWSQCLTLDEAIEYTIQWYKVFTEKNDMFDFSIKQIENYLAKANLLNIKWIKEHNV